MVKRCKNCAEFSRLNSNDQKSLGFCRAIENVLKEDNPFIKHSDKLIKVFENFGCILFVDKNN